MSLVVKFEFEFLKEFLSFSKDLILNLKLNVCAKSVYFAPSFVLVTKEQKMLLKYIVFDVNGTL